MKKDKGPVAGPYEHEPAGSRSIPSLDGIRAISIAMVILSHYVGWSGLTDHGSLHLFLSIVGQGGLGVNAFFILSGFLITTLLLRELDSSGRIHLSRFYLRRSLRIFPPYYIYLLTVVIVSLLRHIHISPLTIATAATYVSNYYPYVYSHPEATGWFVSHTWSLSVEEQFYLCWPIIMSAFRRQTAFKIGVGILIVTPILRLLTALYLPLYSLHEQWFRLFHTNIDVIMTGCILAFLFQTTNLTANHRILSHPVLITFACLYLGLFTFLLKRAPLWFECLIGIPLTSAAIAFLLTASVIRSSSLPGRFLNNTIIRHIGVVSYSLYLWQQLFLGPYNAPSRLAMLAMIFLCAEFSYWLVERPILKMRPKLESVVHFRNPQ